MSPLQDFGIRTAGDVYGKFAIGVGPVTRIPQLCIPRPHTPCEICSTCLSGACNPLVCLIPVFRANVNFTLKLGDIEVAVDWGNATGNGNSLTTAQIRDSGVLDLAAAVVQAAGVWYS